MCPSDKSVMNVFKSCLCKLKHNFYLPEECSFNEELLLGSICDATFYLWEGSGRTFIAGKVTNFIVFFRDTYCYGIFCLLKHDVLLSFPFHCLQNSVVTTDGN